MRWFWTPFLTLLSIVEVMQASYMCNHSTSLTGQMWFMWAVMAVMSSKPYIEKMNKWL